MERVLTGIIGIAVILALALLLSTDRRAIRPRVVGAAFALQAAIAVLLLYTNWGRAGIEAMARGVSNLLGYANKGTEFLFGPAAANPLANTFALGALPVIIFFAALVSILYYLGVMQRIVRWVGGAIGWITGISRVEALGAAANIFVGQSESPLDPALSGGTAAVAAVRRHGRRNGGRRGDDPRRLCGVARNRRPPLPPRRRFHVRPRRHSDGQVHHA